MYSICHLTTAHPRRDIRIFLKEMMSLSKNFECTMLVADGLGDEVFNGVTVLDVGRPKSRIIRFLTTSRKLHRKAVALDFDLYHFHDPDFILAAFLLKLRGKTVIYDVHEDVPRDILSKKYLGILRKPISIIFELLENFCARKFDFIITATPFIKKRFMQINRDVEVINNFPLLSEYLTTDSRNAENRDKVAYVGMISQIRGLQELVRAFETANAKLALAGSFESSRFEQALRNTPGWSNVEFLGQLKRTEVRDLLRSSFAGVVTFYPEPNHINAQPNKIFEYMSAGLPVICSDFPAWREIIDENECGLLVDPLNSVEIAEAVNKLRSNHHLVATMGENGLKAVKLKYNWEVESIKLVDIYSRLLESKRS